MNTGVRPDVVSGLKQLRDHAGAEHGGAGEGEKPPFPIPSVIHRLSRMEGGCRLEQPDRVLRKL